MKLGTTNSALLDFFHLPPPALLTACWSAQGTGRCKLEARGVITVEADETDRRRLNYRLTDKGIDLAPLLLELAIWGSLHERASTSRNSKIASSRKAFLAEVRRRWRERDSTPLSFKFAGNKLTATNWGAG